VQFDTQVINGKNRLVLLYPAAEKGFEPTYARFMGGMTLRLGDGTKVNQIGQLIVTGQRLLGMFTSGAVGTHSLDAQAGSIFAFSVDLDDIDSITPKTNRRGKPVEATLASRDDLVPWFILHIITVAASVKNDGTAKPSSLQNFLARLSPEGRRELQQS
jgi:hypothetical protein